MAPDMMATRLEQQKQPFPRVPLEAVTTVLSGPCDSQWYSLENSPSRQERLKKSNFFNQLLLDYKVFQSRELTGLDRGRRLTVFLP